jgi:transposase
MLITRAYKTELDLNDEQVTACKQHAGAARWAYNWGLARRQEVYKATGKSVWAMELHRELNARKKTDLAWLYEVSKCAPQEGLRNLDNAFRHFFRRCQLKKAGKLKGKVGFPKLKSKKKGLGSFRLTGSIVIFRSLEFTFLCRSIQSIQFLLLSGTSPAFRGWFHRSLPTPARASLSTGICVVRGTPGQLC